MPPATTKKRARVASPEADVKLASPVLSGDYHGRKVVLSRIPYYQRMVTLVKKVFKPLSTIASNRIILSARFEGQDHLLEIPEEMWAEMLPRLTIVHISIGDEVDLSNDSEPEIIEAAGPSKSTVKKIVVTLEFSMLGPIESVKVSVDPKKKINESLAQTIHSKTGVPPDEQRLLSDCVNRLLSDKTFTSAGVKDGDTILVARTQVGGKPVIYLQPPQDIPNVQVTLSPCKSWKFTDIYPPRTRSINYVERIAWRDDHLGISAKVDGTLLDQRTQRKVAYLFWEAHTEPRTPIPPEYPQSDNSPLKETLGFDPLHVTIEQSNSKLLPQNRVTSYLDDSLIALGLHTEARTSFITYWLPKLSQHDYIALRFLPQAAYETAAPLDVSPPPDVVTRVFMLFKGVSGSQVETWEEASGYESSRWPEIVGVDLEKASDKTLFRVLEWGGMEIH